MKRHILLSLTLSMCFAAVIVPASPKDKNPAQNPVIPVLVNVNAKGEVTDVAPAYKLRPAFVRAIRDTLQKMITKPAMEHGKPVSSQFVIALELDTVAQDNGKYSVKFKYLFSKALPPGGDWYWVHKSGHQLALASQTGASSTLFTGSWLQKLQQFNQEMGLHAIDPLTRE